MALLELFIDTTTGNLVSGVSTGQIVPPGSLPFNYGDGLTMKITLLTKTANPSGPGLVYVVIPTTGLTLELFVTDGTVAGGATPYTQQVTWTADASTLFWTAIVAFNTAALLTYFGLNVSAKSLPAYLKIGYVQAGVDTTVFSGIINIGVGIPAVSTVVPAGLTPLSLEQAMALFFPKVPVAGQGLSLLSAAGKPLMLYAVDNTDGAASLGEDNSN